MFSFWSKTWSILGTWGQCVCATKWVQFNTTSLLVSHSQTLHLVGAGERSGWIHYHSRVGGGVVVFLAGLFVFLQNQSQSSLWMPQWCPWKIVSEGKQEGRRILSEIVGLCSLIPTAYFPWTTSSRIARSLLVCFLTDAPISIICQLCLG